VLFPLLGSQFLIRLVSNARCNIVRARRFDMDDFYYSVLHWCCWLVVIGLGTLVVAIPLAAKYIKDSPVKTEFHSAQAAYWCVTAGAVVWALVLIGAVVEHIIRHRI
jgi:hypothetical protein